MGGVDVDGDFHTRCEFVVMARGVVGGAEVANLVVKLLHAQVALFICQHNDAAACLEVIERIGGLDTGFVVGLDDPPLDLAECLNKDGENGVLISQF